MYLTTKDALLPPYKWEVRLAISSLAANSKRKTGSQHSLCRIKLFVKTMNVPETENRLFCLFFIIERTPLKQWCPHWIAFLLFPIAVKWLSNDAAKISWKYQKFITLNPTKPETKIQHIQMLIYWVGFPYFEPLRWESIHLILPMAWESSKVSA